MDDLISRSALKDALEYWTHFPTHRGGKSVHDIIDDSPAVDAVPVVRCKDCVERTVTRRCNCITGRNIYVQVDDDFFCYYGERRGENGK